jgi:hypothetical protein
MQPPQFIHTLRMFDANVKYQHMKNFLLVLAATLSLPLIAFAQPDNDHGQPGADVCYQGQTVHVNGSDEAVQNYLKHHDGATLGACTPPPTPRTPPPAPASEPTPTTAASA